MTVDNPQIAQKTPVPSQGLSVTEADILRLVAVGLSGTGVATTLGIPIASVADSLEVLRRRLGVQTTVQAVEGAQALNLL
jgi:ATP/maltotriose-dependent transcriptional regulator MalT